MRLTTKGRFAVTAMIDVALHGARGPVTLAAISERQKISLSYLEQLFGKLRRSGLVDSVRGPGGGYNLGRAPELVAVSDRSTSVNVTTPDRVCVSAFSSAEWSTSSVTKAACVDDVISGISSVPCTVIVTSCCAVPPLWSSTRTVNVSTTWSFAPRKSSALSATL